jgi:hypothetical protein
LAKFLLAVGQNPGRMGEEGQIRHLLGQKLVLLAYLADPSLECQLVAQNPGPMPRRDLILSMLPKLKKIRNRAFLH